MRITPNIGFIGTGSVARNLGYLCLKAGYPVCFGSRNPSEKREALAALLPGATLGTNIEAAAFGEIVILALPYLGIADLLPEIAAPLAGKIVVDATNPLHPDWSPLQLEGGYSGGEEVTIRLPEASVVKAFNTIFADVMKPEKLRFGGTKATAFICGDHQGANRTVARVADDIGFEALLVGDMSNARYLEGMAHLNIQLAIRMAGGTDAAFKYLKR